MKHSISRLRERFLASIHPLYYKITATLPIEAPSTVLTDTTLLCFYQVHSRLGMKGYDRPTSAIAVHTAAPRHLPWA